MRMEKFEYEFVKESGVRVIIGKGGMKENTERACKEFGAIHCVFPAGNAVVAATEVEEIVDAQWRDLGMPETLWHCRVKEFGPLIVSIDTEGRNLFEENKVVFFHSTFSDDHTNSGLFYKFILKFFHTHTCCRSYRNHFKFVILKRSDNWACVEDCCIFYINRKLTSFFNESSVCNVTASCHASVQINDISCMNIFEILS